MSTNGYRFRIGNFECVAVSDGTWGVGANILFANAPEQELTAIIHAYNLQPEDIPVSETCLAIDTGDHQILVDTGIGIGVGVQTGHLLRNLQAEGIHPNDIHIVILSHGHPDHIGGITDTQGDIAFPNARYVM